MYVFIFTMN